MVYEATCSLMQDSKKGASGVSTSTALYSSAGVLAMWIASIYGIELVG